MGEGEGGEEGDVHRLFWIARYLRRFRSDGGELKRSPSFLLGPDVIACSGTGGSEGWHVCSRLRSRESYCWSRSRVVAVEHKGCFVCTGRRGCECAVKTVLWEVGVTVTRKEKMA